jgi:hypothetical protein
MCETGHKLWRTRSPGKPECSEVSDLERDTFDVLPGSVLVRGRGNLLFHVEQKAGGEVELDMFHVEQDLGALPDRQDHLRCVRERQGL